MSLRHISFGFVLGTFAWTGCASAPQPAGDAAAPPTSAAAGDTTIVAIAPPAPQPHSVFDLLGINQAGHHIGGAVHKTVSHFQNHLGMLFPGLEAKPPLLAITDPANLSEDAPPAVKTAAEVKAEEDQAAQKIKAVRYLATIGCGGCYPDVESALLSSLEDCTEEVRYETVLALRSTAGTACVYCLKKACCSENVQKKLHEIGYETDAAGCPKEPSDRVRRNARLALAQCGPIIQVPEEPEEAGEAGPLEGPSAGPLEGPEGPSSTPAKDADGAEKDESEKSEKNDEPGPIIPPDNDDVVLDGTAFDPWGAPILYGDHQIAW